MSYIIANRSLCFPLDSILGAWVCLPSEIQRWQSEATMLENVDQLLSGSPSSGGASILPEDENGMRYEGSPASTPLLLY